MMHTRKMMLVPATDAYAQQMVPPAVTQMVNLDGEIRQILDNTNIPADMKLLNYNQVLRRYLKLQNDYAEPAQQQQQQQQKQTSPTAKPAITDHATIPFTDAYILNA